VTAELHARTGLADSSVAAYDRAIGLERDPAVGEFLPAKGGEQITPSAASFDLLAQPGCVGRRCGIPAARLESAAPDKWGPGVTPQPKHFDISL
jgi:hypothetical protein